MTKINKNTTREELIAIVVKKFKESNIKVVLVGGAIVSIYTNNKYESMDLDFITNALHKEISVVMSELDFKAEGKNFFHPESIYSVEFPTGPLAIGNDVPIKAEGKIKLYGENIVLLSPTQSVMDRLAWFYHCSDRQCLDQALWICQNQKVNISKIREWSKREGEIDKFNIFLTLLNKK